MILVILTRWQLLSPIQEYQSSQPLDTDAAYADALQSNRGSMHLMRLLAKTGCVWNELTQGTATTLLTTFIGYVNDHMVGVEFAAIRCGLRLHTSVLYYAESWRSGVFGLVFSRSFVLEISIICYTPESSSYACLSV